jgi:hypothetical protein
LNLITSQYADVAANTENLTQSELLDASTKYDIITVTVNNNSTQIELNETKIKRYKYDLNIHEDHIWGTNNARCIKTLPQE